MKALTPLQEVTQSIMFGEFTNDELEGIINAVKYARAQLGRQNARSFKVGDHVKFTDHKRGITYSGAVEKVKLKFALVRTSQTSRFNVPLNLLVEA